ncbi:hypothetical protein LEP3755_59860 [Leptolyngbya sp. NIES-3755]|nr:hypothetical protein LEP3755_59860 [Leptolyngbya sp. NIES-3755]
MNLWFYFDGVFAVLLQASVYTGFSSPALFIPCKNSLIINNIK